MSGALLVRINDDPIVLVPSDVFNNAEGFTAEGTSVTSANSGGGSGTAFSGITGAVTSTQTVVREGGWSYLLPATTGTATTLALPLAQPSRYLVAEAWVYLTGYPTAAIEWMRAQSSTNAESVNLQANGFPQLGGIPYTETSVAVPLNQWCRHVLILDQGGAPGNASITYKIYDDSAGAMIPGLTLTGSARNLGTLPFTSLSIGKRTTLGNMAALYIDAIRAGANRVDEFPAPPPNLTASPLLTGLDIVPATIVPTVVAEPLTASLSVVDAGVVPGVAASPLGLTVALVAAAVASVAGTPTISASPVALGLTIVPTMPMAAVALVQGSSLSVLPTRAAVAAVALAQSSAFAVGPLVTHPSTATLAQSSALAVTPLVSKLAAVALVQSSTLAVSGRLTVTTVVSLTQSSTLDVLGSASLSASAALVSTSTLALSGTLTVAASVALVQSSAMSVSVQGGQSSTVTLVQTSVLAVASVQAVDAAVALAQTSTLAVVHTLARLAAVALVQSSAFTVSPLVAHSYAVALTQSSALVVSVVGSQVGAVGLVQTSTLAVASTVAHPYAVTLVQASTLTVAGRQTFTASVVLAGSSVLGVAGFSVTSQPLSLVQSSTLLVVAMVSALLAPAVFGFGSAGQAFPGGRVGNQPLRRPGRAGAGTSSTGTVGQELAASGTSGSGRLL